MAADGHPAHHNSQRNTYQKATCQCKLRVNPKPWSHGGRTRLYLPVIQMLRWGDKWFNFKKSLIPHHLDCGKDFEPPVACDYCHQLCEMRYDLTSEKLRDDHPPTLLAADDDP